MFVIGSPFVNPQLHSVCILGSTLHSTPDCIVYSLWEYYYHDCADNNSILQDGS